MLMTSFRALPPTSSIIKTQFFLNLDTNLKQSLDSYISQQYQHCAHHLYSDLLFVSKINCTDFIPINFKSIS